MAKVMLVVVLTVLAAHALALLGLLGYGWATGRLGAEARAQYLATWRGEKLVAPAPVEAASPQQESPRQASRRIAVAEVQREMLSREVERDIEVARSMQATLAEGWKKYEADLQRLQQERAAFEKQVAAYNQTVQSEGFQKALKSYSQMKPKLAKDDFMAMPDDQAVQYLAQMKSDTATQIFQQFKTPQEQEKRLRLMKLLEEMRTVSRSGPAAAGALAAGAAGR